jgi:linoleoyl-CoA desaturase
VEAKCKEFNLPYNYYPTMWEALGSHFRVMRQLGKKPATQALRLQAA